MADDDAVKKLEARVTRLEAAAAQQPTAATGVGGTGVTGLPGGAIADPAPWWGGGWGFGGWPGWRPHPIVDAATFAGHRPFPGPVVDPVTSQFAQSAFVQQPGHAVVDPATFAGAAQARAAAATALPAALSNLRPVGDPPPIDVSRFSQAQLEATLHSIAAEKARLSSMETLVNQQLDKLKGQPG